MGAYLLGGQEKEFTTMAQDERIYAGEGGMDGGDGKTKVAEDLNICVYNFLEICDLCGDEFPARKIIFNGRQFLCLKCR